MFDATMMKRWHRVLKSSLRLDLPQRIPPPPPFRRTAAVSKNIGCSQDGAKKKKKKPFLTISEACMKKRDGRKQLWGGALVGSRQTVVIFPGKKKDRTQRKGDYASQKRVVNTGNPTCNSKCSQCSEVLPTYPRNRRLLTLRKTTRGFAESRGGLQVIGAFVDERAKRSVL